MILGSPSHPVKKTSDDSRTLAPVEHATPSMSETLKQWLASQGVSTLGGNESSRQNIQLNADEIHDLWKLCDYFDQVEMAARVAQGYCLARIRASSERDFVEGLKQRDIAISSAYQLIDCYQLFVAFPRLDLLDKAAALGFARIRELKPHFGLDGLRKLIEGEKVDTLTYDAAVKMSKRDIVAWRKARFQAQLELSVQQTGVEVPEVEHAPVKPRALETATDELLGAVSRAWHELERAKRVVRDLLPPGTDEWQHARTELAHAAHVVIRGAVDQANALDDLLVQRFGVTVTRPHAGEYNTLAPSRLVEINNLAAAQADADTNARAKQRHARLKWRGAPPKTLNAVIANARNGGRE
jgi:hypothetical protein